MRLIEKVWFKSHKAKWIIVPILLPLTILFAAISALRRLCYKLGLFASYRVEKPVVIIGNIGVGGNGKTPLVLLLIDMCQAKGLTPGVISRGYGGKAAEYPYLLNPLSTTIETGDEPYLIYQRSKVPVAVGADRIASAKLLVEQGCDIILADDGLQHYRLQRDLEIIVVDGKRLFGNGLLLPAGPLREGVGRLKTADVVISNGGQSHQLTANSMSMQLIATHLCHITSGEKISVSNFIEKNSLVNAIAGIGSPERFFNTLIDLNFTLASDKGFVDHHYFEADDFDCFDKELPLIMTEKDAVKCQGFAKANWWYLSVDAVISAKERAQLTEKISQLI